MIRCVLFDLDGTLLNTLEPLGQAYDSPRVPRFHQDMADAVKLLEGWMLRSALGHRTHCNSLLDKVLYFPFPGVMDMLRDLRAQRYLLGIVTEKSRNSWDVMSMQSGLTSFDVVVTADDVEHHKPDPEGLLAALMALDVSPWQSIYIGDSLLDYEAAEAASVWFGAALWSKDSDEQARFASQAQAAGAFESFAKPSAVIEKLRRWNISAE
jgi:phosphoglycolate phosphatase-like HAD superfamily hydrolase